MTVILAMPCFNEADGIIDFLDDIHKNLGDLLEHIVVVNDCSTDSTVETILNYEFMRAQIKLTSNAENIGHGPSFLNAINQSLEFAPEIVITVDGDGQFRAEDIRRQLLHFRTTNLDVLECVRQGRTDPMFRKLVTFILRYFILICVGKRPMDANTPLRIFRADALTYLVRDIPEGSLIPNLRISALTRRSRFKYAQIRVDSLSRRGTTTLGSSWGTKRVWLPSKRFIQFCQDALVELWHFPI